MSPFGTIVSGEVPNHCDQREDRELVGKEPPSWGAQPRPQQGQAHLYENCARDTLSVNMWFLVSGAQLDGSAFVP